MLLGRQLVPTFNFGALHLPPLAATISPCDQANRRLHDWSVIPTNEVEIPVPWGKIAARHWNPRSSLTPVVCVHGWRDNSASFDNLLPLLAREWPHCQYLAFDLPGHGHSSHFPPGMVYTLPDMLLMFRRIMDYFRWKKINIIGHSLGAAYSFAFTATHPKLVDKLVAIDVLAPVVYSNWETLKMISKSTRNMLEAETKIPEKQSAKYPLSAMLERFCSTHAGKLDEEYAKILMTRGIQPCPLESDMYKFSHDYRIKQLVYHALSIGQVEFLMRNITSDVLRLKASNGLQVTTKYVADNEEEWLSQNEDGTLKGNIVRFVTVEGRHYVHMEDPKQLLSHLVVFLAGKSRRTAINSS